MDYDVIIKGGTIYEGSGKRGYVGDVAVKADRVAAVGKVEGTAKRVIDATGKAVCPGFIDTHTHYDGQIFWDPLLSCSSWHGVTTVVMGNCGVAFAPCRPEQREMFNYMFSRVEGVPEYLLKQAVPWDWESFGEFMDSVQRRGSSLNVVCLMGFSAIRAYVMGDDAISRKDATPEEIEQMKDVVRQGMRDGAFGLSASRMPVHIGVHGEPMPSAVAPNSELIEVFSTLGEFKHSLTEYVGRSFVAKKDLAREAAEDWEMLKTIARKTKRPVSWPILHMYNSPDNWKNFLKVADGAWDEGLEFWIQTSPWIGNEFEFTLERITSIFDDMPEWQKVFKLEPEEREARYRDPEVQKGLRFDVVEDNAPRFFHRRWDLVTLSKAVLEKNRKYEGKTVAQIAEETGRDVFDTFMEISLEEGMQTLFVTATVNGDPQAVLEMLKYPKGLSSLADGGAHLNAIAQTSYPSYILGTWVREKKAITIEQAIDIMVTQPAEAFGLTERNGLKPGNFADIVVFDPETIKVFPMESVNDLPGGGQRMIMRGEGMLYTLVNGEVMMENNTPTGTYPGRVLRSENA
jgi:N-acyl-D-aspartate/D-glutamate deacylase